MTSGIIWAMPDHTGAARERRYSNRARDLVFDPGMPLDPAFAGSIKKLHYRGRRVPISDQFDIRILLVKGGTMARLSLETQRRDWKNQQCIGW
jgi:hypothetical protein